MYQQTAQGLASLGRGGDDTLVHMNKSEVAALNAINQAANNRPLTINPHTGMPEAMDLTSILLGLGIGAAAIMTGGAAAAAAPALIGAEAGGMGALALGAGAGALTGAGLNAAKAAAMGDEDIGTAAGFGAMSGALGGLGGGLGVAGEAAGEGAVAATAGENAVADAATAAIPKDPSALIGEVNNVPSVMTQADKTALLATDNANALGLSPGSYQNLLDSTFGAAPQTSITVPTSGDIVANQASQMGTAAGTTKAGLEAITPPSSAQPGAFEQSFNAMASKFDQPLTGTDKALLGASLATAGLEDQYKQQGLNEQASARQAQDIVNQYRQAGKKAGVTPALPQELLSMANKPTHFAAGGTIRDVQGLEAIAPGYINQQSMTDFYPQSMIPQAQPLQRSMPIRHEVIGYADGGPVGYGFTEGGDVGGGDEGLLHGPGTGQSDGIMGLIQGEQGQEPVRLAEGEFVIPADVVAALGDGSTKAGASALYDMLDRVRQQAYGHTQQMNPVDPSKVMPA